MTCCQPSRSGDDAPSLVLALEHEQFPTRAGRVAIRRFVAPHAIALVQLAADLVEEAVRVAMKAGSEGLLMRARYERRSLFIDITDTNGRIVTASFPLVAARATAWGTERRAEGGLLWIECAA